MVTGNESRWCEGRFPSAGGALPQRTRGPPGLGVANSRTGDRAHEEQHRLDEDQL